MQNYTIFLKSPNHLSKIFLFVAIIFIYPKSLTLSYISSVLSPDISTSLPRYWLRCIISTFSCSRAELIFFRITLHLVCFHLSFQRLCDNVYLKLIALPFSVKLRFSSYSPGIVQTLRDLPSLLVLSKTF